MDLSSFLNDGADGPDHIALLREEARFLRGEAKRIENRCRTIDAAAGAVDGLARLDTGGGFGGYTYERWFFVSAYAHDDSERPQLTSLECIIVPDAVRDQVRHRPRPQTAEQAATGAVTMTPTAVTSREIAQDAVALYASGLRIGTYDDILRERCASCDANAIVFCEHYFDTSNEYQSVFVRRLCVRCPRVVDLAGSSCDLFENLPLLPLKKPHRKR